jgi:arsenate reductase
LLDDEGIPYRYRDYVREPLSEDELRRVLGLLGVSPAEVLRRNDRAYKELGLDGGESDAILIAHMAERPTLLQRPIGVLGDRAVVGRPPERLLELAGGDADPR